MLQVIYHHLVSIETVKLIDYPRTQVHVRKKQHRRFPLFLNFDIRDTAWYQMRDTLMWTWSILYIYWSTSRSVGRSVSQSVSHSVSLLVIQLVHQSDYQLCVQNLLSSMSLLIILSISISPLTSSHLTSFE